MTLHPGDIGLVYLPFLIFTAVSNFANAGEMCYTYEDDIGTKFGTFPCADYCCGGEHLNYCCSDCKKSSLYPYNCVDEAAGQAVGGILITILIVIFVLFVAGMACKYRICCRMVEAQEQQRRQERRSFLACLGALIARPLFYGKLDVQLSNPPPYCSSSPPPYGSTEITKSQSIPGITC